MQSIYFTALICYLPPPPKKQKQTNNKKDKNKLQTPVWPPHPSPTPIHSLNIYQLIQNISLAFSLKPVILITQGGREVELEKGKKKKNNLKMHRCQLCMYTKHLPPHLTRWKQILKTNKSEASWHGLNDCIVKMIFGLLTDGVTTRTRAHTDSLTS